jgi:hypothetical protein
LVRNSTTTIYQVSLIYDQVSEALLIQTIEVKLTLLATIYRPLQRESQYLEGKLEI